IHLHGAQIERHSNRLPIERRQAKVEHCCETCLRGRFSRRCSIDHLVDWASRTSKNATLRSGKSRPHSVHVPLPATCRCKTYASLKLQRGPCHLEVCGHVDETVALAAVLKRADKSGSHEQHRNGMQFPGGHSFAPSQIATLQLVCEVIAGAHRQCKY